MELNVLLQRFALLFWISLSLTIVCAVLLFILTRRRELWLRFTAAEAAFWSRVGLSPKMIESSRRFEEGPKMVFLIALLGVAFLSLVLFTGADYRSMDKYIRWESFHDSGIAEYKAGRVQAAIRDLNKAIELDPTDARAYCYRGVARINLRDYTGAIADNSRAIQLKAKYPEAYNNRGLAKFYKGDYVGAMADADAALALDSGSVAAYNTRGLAEERLRKYQEALADFSRVIQLNSGNALLYNNRGHVKAALKDYAGAIADYNKAIALAPHFTEAISNRTAAAKMLPAPKR